MAARVYLIISIFVNLFFCKAIPEPLVLPPQYNVSYFISHENRQDLKDIMDLSRPFNNPEKDGICYSFEDIVRGEPVVSVSNWIRWRSEPGYLEMVKWWNKHSGFRGVDFPKGSIKAMFYGELRELPFFKMRFPWSRDDPRRGDIQTATLPRYWQYSRIESTAILRYLEAFEVYNEYARTEALTKMFPETWLKRWDDTVNITLQGYNGGSTLNKNMVSLTSEPPYREWIYIRVAGNWTLNECWQTCTKCQLQLRMQNKGCNICKIGSNPYTSSDRDPNPSYCSVQLGPYNYKNEWYTGDIRSDQDWYDRVCAPFSGRLPLTIHGMLTDGPPSTFKPMKNVEEEAGWLRNEVVYVNKDRIPSAVLEGMRVPWKNRFWTCPADRNWCRGVSTP